MNQILENNFQEPFETALGIYEPWHLIDMESKLDETGRQSVFLEIQFARGTKFIDPVTGDSSDVYDTRECRWSHMNFF